MQNLYRHINEKSSRQYAAGWLCSGAVYPSQAGRNERDRDTHSEATSSFCAHNVFVIYWCLLSYFSVPHPKRFRAAKCKTVTCLPVHLPLLPLSLPHHTFRPTHSLSTQSDHHQLNTSLYLSSIFFVCFKVPRTHAYHIAYDVICNKCISAFYMNANLL